LATFQQTISKRWGQKLLSRIRRNIWLLAAFIVPLGIRIIPELLSWPYLLGIDTLRYIPIIQSGQVFSPNVSALFHYHLFFSFATVLDLLLSNGVLVVKILGPVLMGFVSFMMFMYAKRSLGWSSFKSFLVALLTATYFVSLRNSWDLYAQCFGLIFLLAALIVLKKAGSWRTYGLAFGFMVLTVLSHELVAVILFFVLTFEALRLLIKKDKRNFCYLIAVCSLGIAIFLSLHYSPVLGSFDVPVVVNASMPSLGFALFVAGFFVYCYGLLLPFVAFGLRGLKDWFLRYWVVLCVGLPLLAVVFPVTVLFFWSRWVFLLVYPLLFFAVDGLDKLWRFWASHKTKVMHFAPKVLAGAYVILLLTLSGFYLAESPKSQIAFFSTDNPYLSYIPSSMLQNAVPIEDNPSLVACLNWVNTNTPENSTLVIHYALYDLGVIYVPGRLVVPVYEGASGEYNQNETGIVDGMVWAANSSLHNGTGAVFTVWWVSGDGWYKISDLPSVFKEVYQADRMAVYTFDPAS
jgi:hypothetical protein